jgi:hypothetical protein
MYETFQSRALTLYKRLSWSQIEGEAAHLVGVAESCMFGVLGDLLIRLLLRGVNIGLGSLSDALIMTLTV